MTSSPIFQSFLARAFPGNWKPSKLNEFPRKLRKLETAWKLWKPRGNFGNRVETHPVSHGCLARLTAGAPSAPLPSAMSRFHTHFQKLLGKEVGSRSKSAIYARKSEGRKFPSFLDTKCSSSTPGSPPCRQKTRPHLWKRAIHAGVPKQARRAKAERRVCFQVPPPGKGGVTAEQSDRTHTIKPDAYDQKGAEKPQPWPTHACALVIP